MASHGWLVRPYLRALAIIFAYVLLFACGFDLVGMGWVLRMCVPNTFLGILAKYSVLSSPGLAVTLLTLQQGELMSTEAFWGLLHKNQLRPHTSRCSLKDSNVAITQVLRREAEIKGPSAPSVAVPVSLLPLGFVGMLNFQKHWPASLLPATFFSLPSFLCTPSQISGYSSQCPVRRPGQQSRFGWLVCLPLLMGSPREKPLP